MKRLLIFILFAVPCMAQFRVPAAVLAKHWVPLQINNGGGGSGSGTVSANNTANTHALGVYHLAAGSTVIDADTGAYSDGAGALSAVSLNASSSISAGTAPTACGSATGCFAAAESSTAGTPTSSQCYIRADSTLHTYVYSCNGSAELPLGTPITTKTTSTPISVSVGPFGSFYWNQHATAGTAITYNLPVASAGASVCIGNSYNGSAANTGVLTINTSASGQFIIDVDGTLGSTGGHVTSGGAGGDRMCLSGVDATHWQLYCNHGTCTKS